MLVFISQPIFVKSWENYFNNSGENRVLEITNASTFSFAIHLLFIYYVFISVEHSMCYYFNNLSTHLRMKVIKIKFVNHSSRALPSAPLNDGLVSF